MHNLRRMVVAGLFVLAGAGACDDVRRDWSSCAREDCGSGFACVAKRCVPVDGGAFDAAAFDVQSALDVPAPPLDAGLADGRAAEDVVEVVAVAIDAALDGGPDAPAPPAVDVALDVASDAPVDLAVDTRIPDAVGTCASDGDCGGSQPYCVQGLCVACKTSDECGGAAPICSPVHACVSCARSDGGCPAAVPACEVDSGRCVACVSNDGCAQPTKPICDPGSNTCVPCTRDDECAGRGPGVCMAHLDGHCATDTETIYVGSLLPVPCSDTAANAGTAAVPYCTAQTGVGAAKAKGKALVVIAGATGGFVGVALTAPLTVVGKAAVLNAADYADCVGITSGEIYLRDLALVGSGSRHTGIGINAQATPGASLTLHVQDCSVRSNPGGGILLAGAAFAIENTIIAGNGPGETVQGASFGGIRVDSSAAEGPATLELLTITDNLAPGLSCADVLEGTGVLASGNAVQNITSSCAIASCSEPGPACGAQP